VFACHEPFAEIRDMSLSASSAASSTDKASPSAAASGEKPTTASTEFISFAIGDEQYGVDIMAVREIKGWSGVTQLPNQPEYMRGVLNLRGVMVPIVDLRRRFGLGLTEATPVHVVIVVQVDKRTVGLLADRVLDIISAQAAQVQPVPQVSRNIRADFLSGLVTIDETMIALIDLDRLLSEQTDVVTTAAS
jgi:purine-binding chemotaxis protein CheW